MGNHKSLIVEYSSNFEKELVFEKISELCTELSDKNGLHIIVNDLNENGRSRADKITNNYLTWNRFNGIEKNG